MKILIFGASGATGQHLIKQALEQGHTITAFVRDPSKIKFTHINLFVVRGSITNAAQLLEVITGQDAVISALGATSPFKYDKSVVDGLRLIIDVMKSAGVRRLIYMSFMGVPPSRHNGGIVVKYIAPLLLSTEIKGHAEREQLIMESQLSWTIVRPPTLTNGKRLRQYRTGPAIRSACFAATISRADVADFMLKLLVTDDYLSGTPAIMYK